MRIVLLALFLVACFTGCGGKRRVPRGVLPPEKMESVLWDILQADEFLKDYMLSKDSTLKDTAESTRMYERVFRFNKTTKDEFSKSFHYYTTHTSLMKEVMDSLNVRGQKEAEEASRPKPVIDTGAIRKIRPHAGP